MHATDDRTKRERLEELERERARIDEQLRSPLSPRVELLLRSERGWVERKRRALERTRVSSRAVLHSGEVALPANVHDVSAGGAGIEIDLDPMVALPEPGDPIGLELSDLAGVPVLAGTVRHVTGSRIGVEFDPCGAARRAAAELARTFALPDPERH